jgi:hypothetical protein
MAELSVDGDQLVVRLTFGEKVWGLHGNMRLPLSAVTRVSVVDSVWIELRGWRMAGVALPGRVALGTRKHGTGYDFTAIHRQLPVIQVDFNGLPRYERLVVSVPEGADAATEADRIAAAAGIKAG